MNSCAIWPAFRCKYFLSLFLTLAICLARASTWLPTPDEVKKMSSEQRAALKLQADQALSSTPPGQDFIQIGDMLFSKSQVQKDSAFTGTMWPGGVVYYEFDGSVSDDHQDKFRAAAEEWARVASVSFVPHITEPNYVQIQEGDNNGSSYVGMKGGGQVLTLYDWTTYRICHEIGHVLGLSHEQSRSDRDSFVAIHLENVVDGYQINFDKLATANYGTYDFDSVMHYSKYAFSKSIDQNTSNTIVPQPAYADKLNSMGQRRFLSALDKSGMAARYGSKNVSMGYAVDDTGSMEATLEDVNDDIGDILDATVTSSHIAEYVLALFNDPDVPDPQVFGDKDGMINAVAAVKAHDGGDCPELSMQGLINCLGACRENSPTYLFTDADAKDDDEADIAIMYAEEKHIHVNGMLPGNCAGSFRPGKSGQDHFDPIKNAGLKDVVPTYERIIERTGGRIYLMYWSDAADAMNSTTEDYFGDSQTILLSSGTLTGGASKHFDIPIDSTITTASFYICGDDLTTVTLRYPSGMPVHANDTGVSLTQLIYVYPVNAYVITAPTTGTWQLDLTNTGQYQVVASGNSPIAFDRFQFVYLGGDAPKDPDQGEAGFGRANDTYLPIFGMPYPGSTTTGSAELLGPYSSASFDFLSRTGEVIGPANLLPGNPAAASDVFVGDLNLPNEPFRLRAKGLDNTGAPFQRVYSDLQSLEPIKVEVVGSPPTLPPLKTTTIPFKITNLGTPRVVRPAAACDHSLPVTLTTAPLSLGTDESTTILVGVTVPDGTPSSASVGLICTASDVSDPEVFNGAMANLLIANFTRFLDDDTTLPTGWSQFGTTRSDQSTSFDSTQTSLLAHIEPNLTDYRIIGWFSDPSNTINYASVGSDHYVRAKYYIYATGQSGGSVNQIPNFRMRVANRFAVTSLLIVNTHLDADPEATILSQDIRPSTSPLAPSIYRVDLDPIDVPQLVNNPGTEGFLRAFEAYEPDPQANGDIAMTECILGTYPSLPDFSTTVPATQNGLLKRYVTGPSNGGDFGTGNIVLSNSNATIAKYHNGVQEFTPPQPSFTVSNAGVTMETLSVESDRLGVAAFDVFNDTADQTNHLIHARVEPHKQYKLRFHATSTKQSNTQSLVRFRGRTIKFQYTASTEVGGATGASNQNNAIASQALPGIGNQIPTFDKLNLSENGGWYNVLMVTPMNSDIQTTQPHLSAQDGPGVDTSPTNNTKSRLDLQFGFDVIDTFSTQPTSGIEAGQMTVDRVEIEKYDLVPD